MTTGRSAADPLKPCPFCGSSDLKSYTTEGGGAYKRGIVKCRSCGCRIEAESGGFHDYPHGSIEAQMEAKRTALKDAKERVAMAWNRRFERTCRIVMPNRGFWECDACGGGIDWDSCDEDDPPNCTYCPNCGTRVIPHV